MPTSQTSQSRTQTVALANGGVSADTMTALHQFALDLSARRDLNDLLAHAILAAAQLTASPHATLLLLDPAGERICYRVALDNGNLAPLDLVARPMMQRGLAGWVVRERRAALVRDTNHDARWLPAPGLGDLRSAIVAPIVHGDAVLGIMTLGHEAPYHYHADHLNLLELLCAPIALAIELARLAEASEAAPAAGFAPPARLHAPPAEYDAVALAAQLRGLCAAAARHAPAGFDDLIAPFFQAAAAIVQRHGGTLATLDGDTLLAVFHSRAERMLGAASAARELHEATQRLRTAWHLRFGLATGALDIGIASGPITIGALAIGQPATHAFGGAIELARRLSGLARGEILISEQVAAALGSAPGLAAEAQPPLTLRDGVCQPIFRLRAHPPPEQARA